MKKSERFKRERRIDFEPALTTKGKALSDSNKRATNLPGENDWLQNLTNVEHGFRPPKVRVARAKLALRNLA